jgi:hypothetical protein
VPGLALRTPCSMSARVRTVQLKACGQIGAVAETERHASTHDLVAEPFQRP